MTFILGYWRYLAVALVVAAYTCFVYRAGGNAPRAELKALQAASDAYKQESSRIAKEKDRDYEMQMANTQYAWDQYRLQHPIAKPQRLTAVVCADASGNAKLSDALSAYLAEVGRFRSDVETILADADEQQNQLNCAVGWAQTINR